MLASRNQWASCEKQIPRKRGFDRSKNQANVKHHSDQSEIWVASNSHEGRIQYFTLAMILNQAQKLKREDLENFKCALNVRCHTI